MIFIGFAILVQQLQWTLAASQSLEKDDQHSVARRWNDLLLESIRSDFARPVVHARNLFHVSAAMWDAWAVWDGVGSVDDVDGGNGANAIRGNTGKRSSPWLINALSDNDDSSNPGNNVISQFNTDRCYQQGNGVAAGWVQYTKRTQTKEKQCASDTFKKKASNLCVRDLPNGPGGGQVWDICCDECSQYRTAATDENESDTSGSWSREEARRASMSHAAYGLLQWRFAASPGFDAMKVRYDALMVELGYSPDFESAVGNDPRAVGNRIANAYIQFGLDDGSNEINDYANRYYRPINGPLFPAEEGTNFVRSPDRWQPLSLRTFIDQSGHTRPRGEYPEFLGAEWGLVTPFSLREDQKAVHVDEFGNEYHTYIDPGPPPMLNLDDNSESDGGGNGKEREALEEERTRFLKGFEQVLHWSNHLDPTDGDFVDVSPNSIGNANLPTDITTDYSWFYDSKNGGDIGQGYDENPVTGFQYQEQKVPKGDYARILAEFWADGPDSETPPGHWFAILNDVMDNIPEAEKRIGGTGPIADALEYDVKAYFAMGGAMHDAAIAAWGLKGRYDYARPITVIRWMGENGQRSDPNHQSYHPHGLELVPGLVEIITFASTRVGERHQHLKDHIGEIAVHCWMGPDYIEDEKTDAAGCGWILAVDWWPYQRPTFVTPNFAGYVSGHSTFSRTAAEILTLLTGSPYFPGGLGEYVAPAEDFLVFENGPSVDVRLQWVSYRDASDQCSLSRIWGGIHPSFDDIPGRLMGQIVGPQVWELILRHFLGEMGPKSPDIVSHETLMKVSSTPNEPKKCKGDFNNDGRVDHKDLTMIYTMMGLNCPDDSCDEDIDGDGRVGEADLAAFFEEYARSDCRQRGGLVGP